MVVGGLLIVAGLALWIFGPKGDTATWRDIKVPSTFALVLIGVGVFLFPFTPWWPGQSPVPDDTPTTRPTINGEGVDCSQAVHPAFETELRVFILDGLRRHYSYKGEYVVEEITKVGDWAYVEAAPTTTGVDRAYLLQFDGLRWNWRWEGDIGAQPGQPGFPPAFSSVASPALLCDR
jgi:hypothetical protein